MAFPKVSSNKDFQAITLLVKAKIGETQVLFYVRAPLQQPLYIVVGGGGAGGTTTYILLCFSAQDYYYFSFATSKTSSVRRKELVGILLHTRKLLNNIYCFHSNIILLLFPRQFLEFCFNMYESVRIN